MELITTTLPFSGVMSSMIGGRKENQDTCGYAETPRGLLLVVCDGMGGGPAGKTASVIATSVIIDFVKSADEDKAAFLKKYASLGKNEENTEPQTAEYESENPYGDLNHESQPIEIKTEYSDAELLENAVKVANREMRYQIYKNPDLEGMGTTVAAVLIDKEQATIAHVGDSRIYQIRDGKIVFRTADHSRVGEMVRMGNITEEQARLSAYSNIITRALGVDEDIDVEIDIRPYEKGDRFVLCTDGVWGAKPQPEMVKLFVNNQRSLQGTMDVLNLEVENAGKEKGGNHDNYSAIILEVNINSILKEKMSKKVKKLFYGLGTLCCISICANIVLAIVVHHYRGQVITEKDNVINEVEQISEINSAIVPNNGSSSLSDSKEELQMETTKESSTNIISTPSSTSVEGEEKVEKLKEEVQQTQIEDNKDKLVEIIAQITTLKEMKKGSQKNQLITQIRKSLDEIKPNFDEEDQKNIEDQKEKVNNFKNENPDDRGGAVRQHYQTIIENLQKILNK